MKKLSLLLLSAIVIVPAMAQMDEAGPASGNGRLDVNRIRLGAYVAPNISWMHPTAATDDENRYNVKSNGSKIGFTYGLMAEYFFAKNYGIVTGLQVNATGGKVIAERIAPSADKNTINRAEFDYRLQYLEVPLALKLRTDNINGFRFFGQLGVTAGFNIGKKADYTVRFINNNGSDTTATGEKIKLKGDNFGPVAPILFQMNLGVGTEYHISDNVSAYFGLFFNNGFAPDATNPDNIDGSLLGYGNASFRDGNTRLNNFSLRVGLFF